jgi:hypothetical protein
MKQPPDNREVRKWIEVSSYSSQSSRRSSKIRFQKQRQTAKAAPDKIRRGKQEREESKSKLLTGWPGKPRESFQGTRAKLKSTHPSATKNGGQVCSPLAPRVPPMRGDVTFLCWRTPVCPLPETVQSAPQVMENEKSDWPFRSQANRSSRTSQSVLVHFK